MCEEYTVTFKTSKECFPDSKKRQTRVVCVDI